MDHLSQGQSMDDGLSHSPPACGLPGVFDLSKRHRDIPVNPTSGGPLHLVRAPRWCGMSGRGAELLENSSTYHDPLSAQQVRPDDAFSNTTVTLSYINRSPVLSTQDSLPPKPHTVTSVASNLSQRSPSRDSTGEAQVREAVRGRGGHSMQAINRHAGGVTPKSEQLKAYSKAPPMEGSRRGGIAHVKEQITGLNGTHEHFGPSGAMMLEPCHTERVTEFERSFSQDRAGEWGRMQNGISRSLWDVESCKGTLSEHPTVRETRVEERRSGGKAATQGRKNSRHFCSPLNKDYTSSFEQSLSLAVSTPDNTEEEHILPQTLNSPSTKEANTDAAGMNLVVKQRGRVTVSGTEVTNSPEDSSSNNSEVMEVPVTGSFTLPPAGGPQPVRILPGPVEQPAEEAAQAHSAQKMEWKTSEEYLNGNTPGEKRVVGIEKQPTLSRRVVRGEAAAEYFAPFRSKLSTTIQSVEQNPDPETHTDQNHPKNLYFGVIDSTNEVEAAGVTAAVLQEDSSTGRQESQRSTSGSEDRSFAKSHKCSTSSPGQSTSNADMDEVEMGEVDSSLSQSCSQKEATKTSKEGKPQQRSHTKQHGAASRGNQSASKSASSKKRKKRKRAGQSSSLPPQEPEIRLKYATYREEKKDVRAVTFAPYVRLEQKEFSTCTIINYPEEENCGPKKGRARQTGPGLSTGTVPATSYLELARLDAEGRRQGEQACCLCFGSTNAMDLGDLHGPYRAPLVKSNTGAPTESPLPKEEEACSDSDSSYDGHGRKHGCGQVERVQLHRLSHGLKRDAALAAQCRWVSDDDSPQSPLAKRPWPGSILSNQPSILSEALETTEFWLHEDCGVWSPGVFLVRGKLYGLEEAVRLAQETSAADDALLSLLWP
ncbi:hypothetical protein JZ751_013061 [Albula glossodonta]|uniref:Uncharacterized protein n=1 Tax=Albula glossodonta TaxID=121402 RepID=A0A8T2NRY0_9TELE|nr:hypothetical protein JZ751_013061 [Albula glossodonta]